MGEQASLPPRVLQTAAALFQEGEKIPSRTPCRGQPRGPGQGPGASWESDWQRWGRSTCGGRAACGLALPSRASRGRGSRGLLTQDKDETALVSQDPYPEAQDHSAQDLEEEWGS